MTTETPPPTTLAPVTASKPVTTVTAGTLIMDTYEIEKLINSGGMGEVYRGHNIHNGEPVAIKIVLPSLAHDPKIVALFQKESTVLSRLSHDAIVRYHTFTIDRSIGRPCMVMEFVSGTPLGDRVDQGPMPLEDVKIMFRRIAGGLDKAHRAGVVHRDLSPDNVILEEGSVEHAKLIDFGIAKSTNIGAGTLLGGQFAGKFNWVSPEQLGAYGGHVDGRSDIYSTALLIAAASRGAVVPMGASIVDAVGKRASVPDLTGVDPELLPLLSYMLQPDPARRPDSMAAVIAALDNPALIPVAETTPPIADPNRTIIGGVLPPQPGPVMPQSLVAPLTPVAAMPVVVAQTAPPAAADWGVPTAQPQAPAGATVITSQPPTRAAPEDDADASPFGAPTATRAASTPAPQVAVTKPKKGKGGLIAVLGLLLVAGAGAGAIYGGFVDPAVLFGEEQTAEQRAAAEAEAAAQAAAEAEAEAAKLAEAEEAKLAEAKAAEEAAAAKAIADAEAAKLAEAEVAKLAEAEALKLAQEAEAAKAAEAAKLAEAAKMTEAEAAKATEAAKAAETAAAAAAQAKLAEEQAAAQLAEEQAAKEEAARQKAAAEAAANADPMARQLAWIDSFAAPGCVHLRLAETKGSDLLLDGFATTTAPLETVGQTYLAETGVAANLAVRLINDTQCPILDFANQTRSPSGSGPAIRLDNPAEAVKSGSTVAGVVSGLDGRPFALILVSEVGVASALSPYVTVAADGTARFSFKANLPAGRPPAPHLLLAVVTDTELAVLGQLKPDSPYSAQLLMPFLSKKLADGGVTAVTTLGFFRLEN